MRIKDFHDSHIRHLSHWRLSQWRLSQRRLSTGRLSHQPSLTTASSHQPSHTTAVSYTGRLSYSQTGQNGRYVMLAGIQGTIWPLCDGCRFARYHCIETSVKQLSNYFFLGTQDNEDVLRTNLIEINSPFKEVFFNTSLHLIIRLFPSI